MEELRIGIVGSRRRNTYTDSKIVFDIILRAKQKYPDRKIVVVSGACKKGADAMAANHARTLGVDLKEFPIPEDPPVKHRGEFTQRAYKRNRDIAEYCHVLFALVHPDRTGGTENTVSHAVDLKKKFFLVDQEGRCYLSGVGWKATDAEASYKT